MTETESQHQTVEEKLAMLNIEIEEVTKNLATEKMRRFVELLPSAESGAKAMRDAGYGAGGAAKKLKMLREHVGVKRALTLIRRRDQLSHGIEPAWKRQALVDIVETASSQGTTGIRMPACVESRLWRTWMATSTSRMARAAWAVS